MALQSIAKPYSEEYKFVFSNALETYLEKVNQSLDLKQKSKAKFTVSNTFAVDSSFQKLHVFFLNPK